MAQLERLERLELIFLPCTQGTPREADPMTIETDDTTTMSRAEVRAMVRQLARVTAAMSALVDVLEQQIADAEREIDHPSAGIKHAGLPASDQ